MHKLSCKFFFPFDSNGYYLDNMSTEEGEFIDDEAQKTSTFLYLNKRFSFPLQFTPKFSLDSNNFWPFHGLTPCAQFDEN